MSCIPHEPTVETRAQVVAFAAMGTRQDAMAAHMEIDAKTLRKWYRKELDQGKMKAHMAVANALYRQATTGNTAAAIFWLKSQSGWREKDPNDEEVREINVTIRDATGV